MGWTDIKPPAAAASPTHKAVVRMSQARNKILLMIRARDLDGADFLTAGKLVGVVAGFGEHAGMLRLTRPGAHLVKTGPGRVKDEERRPVLLVLPLLPGMTEGVPHKPQGVEFDYGADWLELTLPDWAQAAPSTAVTPRATAAVMDNPVPAAAARSASRPQSVLIGGSVNASRAAGGKLPW